MSVTHAFLLRAFGRPRGVLGRAGGLIMARTNYACARWVVRLLKIQPNDHVLEVGFGPGVAIQLAATLASDGFVGGVDSSVEMVGQAKARNSSFSKNGRVDLRHGSAESLPFEPNAFDKEFAINSMQVWADAIAGLREMWRVTKIGGRVALAFSPYSGYAKTGLIDKTHDGGLHRATISGF